LPMKFCNIGKTPGIAALDSLLVESKAVP